MAFCFLWDELRGFNPEPLPHIPACDCQLPPSFLFPQPCLCLSDRGLVPHLLLYRVQQGFPLLLGWGFTNWGDLTPCLLWRGFPSYGVKICFANISERWLLSHWFWGKADPSDFGDIADPMESLVTPCFCTELRDAVWKHPVEPCPCPCPVGWHCKIPCWSSPFPNEVL